MLLYDDVIKELKKQYPIEDQLGFNEFNIKERLEKNPYLVLNYRSMYLREKEKLDRIEALRDKIIGERYDWYRFNYTKELSPKEVKDYYLPKDEKVIKVNTMYSQQQWKVSFFEACEKSMIQQGWSMKSWLEEKRI